MARSSLLWLALSASLTAGCAKELCRSAAPSFEVTVRLASGTAGIASLHVEVEAAGLKQQKTLTVGTLLEDRVTTFAVDLAPGKGTAGFEAVVRVQAIDADGNVIARSKAEFPASGDACNFFELTLDRSAEVLSHAWSKSFGGTGYLTPKGLAIDAQGNVYVAGYFEGTVDFGGGPLVSQGKSDIFVLGVDPSGNHRFSAGFGGALEDQGLGVAVDAQGNAHLVGTFEGTFSVGGQTLTSKGNKDGFVISVDPAGKPRFALGVGGSEEDWATGIAADAKGNLVVVGDFVGAAQVGGQTLQSAGDRDMFLLALDPTGQPRYSARCGAELAEYGNEVTIAADETILLDLYGSFSTTSTCFGGPLACTGTSVLLRLSPAGELRGPSCLGKTTSLAVAVGPDSSLYAAGSYQQAVDLGGGPLTTYGGEDAYLLGLDAKGTHRFSIGFGGTAYDGADSLALDKAGNLYAAGTFGPAMRIDGWEVPGRGDQANPFLVSVGPTGKPRFFQGYGGLGSYASAAAVKTDGAGNVYVTGYFSATASFGGKPLVARGGYDAFLLKLAPKK